MINRHSEELLDFRSLLLSDFLMGTARRLKSDNKGERYRSYNSKIPLRGSINVGGVWPLKSGRRASDRIRSICSSPINPNYLLDLVPSAQVLNLIPKNT